MAKKCIFEDNKICNNCGECDVCDLNPNKKCDNCGKCLELEKYDIKSVNINEVIEDNNNINDETNNTLNEIITSKNVTSKNNDNNLFDSSLPEAENSNHDVFDNKDMWEYIDDVTDLNRILEDENLVNELTSEEYPGLIRLSNHK